MPESQITVVPLCQVNKTKTSAVFRYFGVLRQDGKEDADYYYCSECYKDLVKKLQGRLDTRNSAIRPTDIHRYKKSVSTHSLHHHLSNHHNISASGSVQEQGMQQLDNFFGQGKRKKSSSGSGISSKKRKEMNFDSFLWFAGANIAFNTLECKSTKAFLSKYLGMSAEDLPSRKSVINAGEKCYNEVKQFVFQQIGADKHVSGACSFDIWTCKHSKRAFIGVTYHFIDDNWTQQSVLLDTDYFSYPHTGKRINEYLSDLFERHKCIRKSSVHVTDAASNNVKFGNMDSNTRINCDSHGLHHLVIDDGVKKNARSDELVKKIKKIVRHLVWRGQKMADQALFIEFEERNKELDLDEQFPLGSSSDVIIEQAAVTTQPKSSNKNKKSVYLKQEVPTRSV